MLKHKAVRSITLPMWYFCDLRQTALTTREQPLPSRGHKGSYGADDMLLSQSAARSPVEMRNKPH